MIVRSGSGEGEKGANVPTRLPGTWTGEFLRRVNPVTLTTGFHKAEPGMVSPRYDSEIADFDIWYVAAGSGEVLADGRWTPFVAGDLVTMAPGSLFQRERTGTRDPFQIYFTHVLPFGRDDGGLNAVLARVWPRRISLLHRPELPAIFDRLFEAYATRTDDSSLAVRGLALQLLHVIFQELREAPSATPPRACLGLLRAKGLIEKEYARDLSLDEIAAHGGISASHLSALFARHFGHPPIEYLVRVRLREAKLLLARGTLVKEAAHAVGFHSQHYFSRAFRQRTGMSPTEFAEQHARK